MKRFAFLAAIGLAILSPGMARAQEIASFFAFGRPLSYTSTGGSATLMANSSNVIFGFDTGPLSDIPIDATLSYMATTSSSVEPDAVPISGNSQLIADTSPGAITFTADEAVSAGGTSIAAGDTLLTVSFTNALLRPDTNTTASIQAADGEAAVAGPPIQTVNISSPVLGISFIDESFSLALNSIQPALSVPTSDGFFNDFTSQFAGSFSGAIPEPASLALFGVGLIGLPTALAVRRRRAKA